MAYDLIKHRLYVNKYKKQLELKIREYIWEVKCNAKCLQCNFNHPAALVFHHRNPKDKRKPIGKGKFCSIKQLKEEIEKCDILCSNCHRELHQSERFLEEIQQNINKKNRQTNQ